MPREIQYLTVQDHLWINLQVTKKKNRWNFAKLEEGTFYQYAYGKSTEFVGQAARYVSGFVKQQPFDSGNEATAFVGLLAFLTANGYHWSLDDKKGVDFFDAVVAGGEAAERKIMQFAKWHDDDHHATIEAIGNDILDRFPKTIEKLAARVPVS